MRLPCCLILVCWLAAWSVTSSPAHAQQEHRKDDALGEQHKNTHDRAGDAQVDTIPEELPRETREPLPRFEGEYLLGDLWGARSEFYDAGIHFDSYLLLDFSIPLNGGKTRRGVGQGLFNLGVDFDLEKLLGVPGGSAYTNMLWHFASGSATEQVGDAQEYNNLDAPEFIALYEAWYQQLLFDDKLRLRVGKMDANNLFAYPYYGGAFVNSSYGYSPTILSFPTYPDSAFGGAAFFNFTDELYIAGGLFDGSLTRGVNTGRNGLRTVFDNSGDLFSILEGGIEWGQSDEVLPGRLAAGVWHHSGDFPSFDGKNNSGTAGWYAIFDQLLWLEEDSTDQVQGIGLSVQFGFADDDVALMDRHVGVAMEWIGAIEGRDYDVIGVGGTWVHFSQSPDAPFVDEFELAFEAFYQFAITPHIFVKPDVQYIVNPGGEGDVPDTWVFTLRFETYF